MNEGSKAGGVGGARLYLTLIPEALVASMLPPEAYGSYLAVGLQAKTRGQAIFFEVDPARVGDAFDVAEAMERCARASSGQPKHSVYVSIYRVLERLPLAALGRLHLATDDGRVLALAEGSYPESEPDRLHLYQELAPVKPRVASRWNPREFARRITEPGRAISLPKVAFAELVLHELAVDPEHPRPGNLPYPNLEHLRDCLRVLRREPEKMTKMVMRHLHQELLFRTIRHGFFVGGGGQFKFYPMPPVETLEREHRDWWRSALTVHME